MGQTLSSPVTSTLIERSGSEYFRVGVASMQGWRLNHEDTHTQHCEWMDKNISHFAVFDGHGGFSTAKYVGENLYKDLLNVSPPFLDDDIKQCFINLDEKFFQSSQEHSSGSTCVSAIITKNKENENYLLKVSNLGDSRAVLFSKDGVLKSTNDHKPDNHIERRRIESAGGFVSGFTPARLNGSLSLSRAFGDFQYKRDPKFPVTQQKVSVEPEVYTWEAKEGDILVLACDGIFDVFENAELKNGINKRFGDSTDLGLIAADIILESLRKGSQDNMTIMIIAFENGKAFISEPELTLGNFYQEDDTRVKDSYINFALSYGFEIFPNYCHSCNRIFKEMLCPCPCRKAFYCSEKCQDEHFEKHKNDCIL